METRSLAFAYSAEKLWTYNELIQNNWQGCWLVQNGQYERAESMYRIMLGDFFKQQNMEGQRYHKGLPYHNLAVALAAQKKSRDSAKYFVLAYIEDLLSVGDEADNWMAALALTNIGVPRHLLEIVKTAVSSAKPPPLVPDKLFAGLESRFEEIALKELNVDELLSLLSTESSQELGSVIRIHMNRILSRMNRDRYVVWGALIVSIISIIITVLH